MIGWIEYRQELRRLEASKRRTAAAYAKDIEKAKREGATADAKYGILNRQEFELSCIDDEIDELVSRRLVATADKLGLSHPDRSAWEVSRQTGLRHLTDDARAALQTAIRNERKERLQLWELRAKIIGVGITGATGLVGALIGLIAILKK